ncbi:MAG: hypothetical protein ABI761_14280 [Saprospiraceae bacterium]
MGITSNRIKRSIQQNLEFVLFKGEGHHYFGTLANRHYIISIYKEVYSRTTMITE